MITILLSHQIVQIYMASANYMFPYTLTMQGIPKKRKRLLLRLNKFCLATI